MSIDCQTDIVPRLRFWGVRGSYPTPGVETLIFGGNTACIEVQVGAQQIVVDAGTGIVALGRTLCVETTPIHILLTHLHHDHIIGLPFFKPMYHAGREVHLWCGNLGGQTAEAALAQMFAPPLFPMRLDQLPADVIFHGFGAGETLHIGGQTIRTCALVHPSGATGYRFDRGGGSAAIITDIEHVGEIPDQAVVELCRGVDTLVYDTMIEESDYGLCKGWGHSTITAGLQLADAADARRFVGFHHSPLHDDTMLEQRAARISALRPGSSLAKEGELIVCAAAEEYPGRRERQLSALSL